LGGYKGFVMNKGRNLRGADKTKESSTQKMGTLVGGRINKMHGIKGERKNWGWGTNRPGEEERREKKSTPSNKLKIQKRSPGENQTQARGEKSTKREKDPEGSGLLKCVRGCPKH